ncbi:hypothetical protein GOP47_0001801 [Adiantum capillus-veneris]|uniref:Uncharacterized protein n=1 Tax=Adiantum capillus-veneris TaxID=13818 RepID=A0A9D4ZNF1_ADICA|nr:hypothetical protein GOP47_0001801 [Adiantum capillus-veneris]
MTSALWAAFPVCMNVSSSSRLGSTPDIRTGKAGSMERKFASMAIGLRPVESCRESMLKPCAWSQNQTER